MFTLGHASHHNSRLALSCRQDSYITADSDTSLDLPGPGRTLGKLYRYLGGGLEHLINYVTKSMGRTPTAVKNQIMRIASKLEGSVNGGYSELTKADEASLSKSIQLLLKMARYTSRLIYWRCSEVSE